MRYMRRIRRVGLLGQRFPLDIERFELGFDRRFLNCDLLQFRRVCRDLGLCHLLVERRAPGFERLDLFLAFFQVIFPFAQLRLVFLLLFPVQI